MKQGKLFFLLLPLLTLVGCGKEAPRALPERMIQVNLGGDPATLDPRKASETRALTLAGMFFEGLMRVGPSDRPELAMAKEVKISKDRLRYKFILRDALWSNGQPVTAYDFVASWRETLDPSFASSMAYHLYPIKGAREIKEGRGDAFGVKVLNEKAFVVELARPTPYFLELTAHPVFFPVNVRAQDSSTLVGNGPFRMEEWRHGDQITALKSLTYWDAQHVELEAVQLVMVDEVTDVNLYEKGETHWAGSPLSTLPVDGIPFLKESGGVNMQPVAGTRFIHVNTEEKLVSHPKIRKALALAIDRQAIVDHVTQGAQLPSIGFVPSRYGLSSSPYYADGAKEEALQLFNEGLEELGIDKEAFAGLSLTYAFAERTHLTAQAVQQQWNKALGFQVHLQSLEMKVYYDSIARGQFQLALGSWIADFNDPVNFLEVFESKHHSSNYTGWEDARYADLLEGSAYMIGKEERKDTLALCEKILMDAMPVIPIYTYTFLYMKHPNLDGVLLTPLGQLDFKWARFSNAEK